MESQDQATQDQAVQDGESQGGAEQQQQQGELGYDKGDYIARVKNEPEFAAEQVREKDKKYTELQNQYKRFANLEPYVDAVGAESVQQYLEVAAVVQNHPQLAEIVNEVRRTGQLPTLPQQQAQQGSGQDNDDDLYMDPVERELKTLRQELASLKDSNATLQGQLNQQFAQANARSMKAGIDKNVDAVMGRYAVNDEIREKLATAIERQVSEAERNANSQNRALAEQSIQLLEMLHGDKGEETLLRMIAPVLLESDGLKAIALASETKRVKDAASQDTGSPAATRTAGGDSQAQELSYSPNLVRDALARNLKKADRDPSTYRFTPSS